MSSASEEKRKIEEEINQKLKELDKIENKENAEKSTRIKKFAKEGFTTNIIITIMALLSYVIIDWTVAKATAMRPILIVTISFSFFCVIVDFIAFCLKREKKLSDFFTGFIIFINIPAFLLTFVVVIFLIINSNALII